MAGIPASLCAPRSSQPPFINGNYLAERMDMAPVAEARGESHDRALPTT